MNAARGEVALAVDGAPKRLCLTLGAMAEIETAFGCTRISELEVRLSRLLRGQGGSVSAAAEAGARFVLLDAALSRTEVSGIETGMALIWKARGSVVTQARTFTSRETLPWQVCQLRVRMGQASWIRRSRGVADSWSFPDAPNSGRFVAEFDLGAGFAGRIETSVPICVLPAGTVGVRVAEVSPDGRSGPWLSIGPGSPYL